MAVQLYHFPGSLCSQKVRIALAEKGVEWDEVVVNILRGDNLQPDYMKKNPKGVVPTLVHNGEVITNSRRILAYIDKELVGPNLSRGDPELMQAWLRLQDLMPIRTLTYGRASGFVGRLRRDTVSWKRKKVEKALTRFPSLKDVYSAKLDDMKAWEAELRDSGAVRAAVDQVTGALDTLNQALATRTWLAGENYTLADVAWTPVLLRLEAVGLGHLWTDGKRPHLARYVEQARRRPSFEMAITRFGGAMKKCVRAAALARYRWRIIIPLVLIALAVGGLLAWPQIEPLLHK